jgi:hypothetical protein
MNTSSSILALSNQYQGLSELIEDWTTFPRMLSRKKLGKGFRCPRFTGFGDKAEQRWSGTTPKIVVHRVQQSALAIRASTSVGIMTESRVRMNK